MMNFDDYQRAALSTAIYPRAGSNLEYPVLGLCGEVGEIAQHVKRMHRDDGGSLTPDRRDALASEVGDALWYLAVVAAEAGLALSDVAAGNLAKLHARERSGQLHGAGDDR